MYLASRVTQWGCTNLLHEILHIGRARRTSNVLHIRNTMQHVLAPTAKNGYIEWTLSVVQFTKLEASAIPHASRC